MKSLKNAIEEKQKDALKNKLSDRVKWLEEKLREMRRVGGPDYSPSVVFQNRCEGEIGGLKWVLKELA